MRNDTRKRDARMPLTLTDYEEAKKALKDELKFNRELKRDLLLSNAEIEHLKEVINAYEDGVCK